MGFFIKQSCTVERIFKKYGEVVHVQWRIQDGAFGANAPPPPPHLVEKPATLLIKIGTKRCQAKISLSTHENMHISLAFITNSPETKAN